jgi:hypothetical protein
MVAMLALATWKDGMDKISTTTARDTEARERVVTAEARERVAVGNTTIRLVSWMLSKALKSPAAAPCVPEPNELMGTPWSSIVTVME